MVYVDMELDINRREIQDKIREKVKTLMQEKGLKQKDLVEKSGLSQVFISYFLTGKRNIGFNALEKIAQALGVSVAELLSSPEEKKTIEVEKRTDLVILPVYSGVPASGFEGGDVELIDYLPTPREMLQGIPENRVAWVRVLGDSMEPKVKKGDMILVADGSYVSINNGDLVIAVLDGEKTLKRFYDKGDFILLQPENEKYEPLIIRKEELKEKPLYLYKVLWIAYRP